MAAAPHPCLLAAPGVQAWPMFGELLTRALALVSACDCAAEAGCPGCVQFTHCLQYNAALSKAAGRVVLESLIR